MRHFLLCITLFLLPVTHSLAQNKSEIRLDRRYTQALLPNDSFLPLKEMVEGRPVWNLMDLRTGKMTPLQVDTMLVFNQTFLWENMIMAAKNGKWGIVSPTGQIILPFEYDWIERDNWFPWPVKKGVLWGLVDRKGQVIVTPMYKSLGYTDSLFIRAILPNDEWGLLDRQGKVLVPYNSDLYTLRTSPDRNLVILQNEEKENALFNIRLQEYVLPFERQKIEFQTLSVGQTTQLVEVRRENAYGLGNADGHLITPVHYNFIAWATDKLSNYATAKLSDPETGENIFHFIDEKGAIVGITAPGYSMVDCVYDGLAAFRTKDWAYGFLNTDGTVAIPPIYANFKPFRSGQALVTLPRDTCVFIDKKGKIIQTFVDCSDFHFDEWQQFASFHDRTGKYGLMDKNKKIIIKPSEQFADHFLMTNWTSEMTHIKASNGKEGVLKANGTILFQPIYDNITWDRESCRFFLEKGREHLTYSLDKGKFTTSVPIRMEDDEYSPEMAYMRSINHNKYGRSIMTNRSFALFKDGAQLILVYRR